MFLDRMTEERDKEVALGNSFTICKRCVEKEKATHPEKYISQIEREMEGNFTGMKLAAIIPERDVYLCADCLKELYAKISDKESTLSVLNIDPDAVMAEVSNNGNKMEENKHND